MCPECLREASVGYQCVDCVAEAERGSRRPLTVAGARLSTKPVIVPVLVALNVLVYVASAAQAGSAMNNARSGLFSALAMWSPAVTGAGQWWRLVTSGFLHIGLLHLVVNMIALWVIGRDLELVLGRLRFSAVYLLAMLGGSTAVFLFGELSRPVAGASGAIYGLMGGIAIAALRLKLNMRSILMIIGINIVLTISLPGISLLGHLGGLVIGGVATAAMLYAPVSRRSLWQAGALAALLVVLVLALITRDLQLGEVMCVRGSQGLQCYSPRG